MPLPDRAKRRVGIGGVLERIGEGLPTVGIDQRGERADRPDHQRGEASAAVAPEQVRSEDRAEREQPEEETPVEVGPDQEQRRERPEPSRSQQGQPEHRGVSDKAVQVRPDVQERSGHRGGETHREEGRDRVVRDPPDRTEQEQEGDHDHPPLPPGQRFQPEAVGPGRVDQVREPLVMQPGLARTGERPRVDGGNRPVLEHPAARGDVPPQVRPEHHGVAERPERQRGADGPQGRDQPTVRSGLGFLGAGGRRGSGPGLPLLHHRQGARPFRRQSIHARGATTAPTIPQRNYPAAPRRLIGDGDTDV